MTLYSCPLGYDCAFSNSCPAAFTPCPAGWFCSSIEGLADRSAIAEALAVRLPEDAPTPGPWVEAECPLGFYCANATTIAPCPRGHWCPEGSVAPLPCDALSLCSGGAGYQINFAAALLAILYTLAIAAASIALRWRQRAAAARCRALQAHGASNSASSFGAALVSVAPSHARVEGLAFSLRGVSVVASHKSTRVLTDANIDVRAGRVTVLLGPSGCGKSSLLSILARGAAPPGCCLTAGAVDAMTSTGAPVPASALRGAVGLVPQEDTFERSLTPRELLTFAAELRGCSSAAAAASAEGTLRDLGLEGVADVIVGGGGGGAAAISGGQVKRVSIAMELVWSPCTLLLDEPTSGLDATAALALLARLRSIAAERGTTIVISLSQPRAEAFACADDVVLLTGGRVAFTGLVRDAVPFVARALKSETPVGNPADYLVDALSGRTPGSAGVDLAAMWAARDQNVVVAPAGSGAASTLTPHSIVGFVHQTALHARRALLIRLRDAGKLILFAGLHAFMALVLSSGFSVLTQKSYLNTFNGPILSAFSGFLPAPLAALANANTSDLGLQQLAFFLTISCGTASGMSSISNLGGLSSVFLRETRGGANACALGIGRMMTEFVIVLFVGVTFSGVWMLFGHSGHWFNWLAVIVGTSFAATGVGHVASLVATPTAAATIVQLTMIVTSVFSGVQPHLNAVLPYPVLNWAWVLSFATYAAQGAYATWAEYQLSYRDVDGAAKTTFGFDVRSPLPHVGTLFGIGLLWRALALAIIEWRFGEKWWRFGG